MKFKLFGFTYDDVDFAFIDFYTIGHFIFGYVCCLVVYIIMVFLMRIPNFPGVSITITTNIGLFWEFFENFYLHKKGFKFDNRRDSFANSLTDVLFVNIGGIVCGIITLFSLMTIFISSVLILTICLALYEFLRRITFSEKNNYGKRKENSLD